MVVEVVEEEHTRQQFQHQTQDLVLVEQVEAVSEVGEEIDLIVPSQMVNLVVLELPDMVEVVVEQVQLHHPQSCPLTHVGGNGGSGTAVIRYVIGATQTGTAKATGGAISFHNNKVIHTFTSSGTFNASESLTVEYVAIGGGGGGAGGDGGGGGGGAGLFLNETGISVSTDAFNITIGGGGTQRFRPFGASDNNAPYNKGNDTIVRFPSGTKTATGGGGGGGNNPTASVRAGGSGGGAGNANPGTTGGPGSGDPYPGTRTTPSNGWGHDGGVLQVLPVLVLAVEVVLVVLENLVQHLQPVTVVLVFNSLQHLEIQRQQNH